MASLELKSIQYWCHFDHFEPPWSSQKLSGRPPKASLDIDRRPKPSPKRNPSYSYNKTINLEDRGGHVRTTNKPQPPPPVELFFDSASYTSSVKGPTRRAPRVGGFRGPAATCADPGKGNVTQRLLRPKLKTRTELETPNCTAPTQSFKTKDQTPTKTTTERWLPLRSISSCK